MLRSISYYTCNKLFLSTPIYNIVIMTGNIQVKHNFICVSTVFTTNRTIKTKSKYAYIQG